MTPGVAGRPGAAAASVLVRDLLTGPVRSATVVADGPAATYLDVGGRLVAVVQPGGVRLPCAVVLAEILPSPHVAPVGAAGGTGAFAVGGGAIHRAGRPVAVVTRWFDPRVRLGRVDPVACERLGALVRSLGAGDDLLPAGPAERLGDRLHRNDPRGAVAGLLGRGTGLTPAGDDLLAGALAALRARRSPAADGLGAAVRSLAPVRTTRLSAALLAAADAGAVVPEAAAVLRAVASTAGWWAGRAAGRDPWRAVDSTAGWSPEPPVGRDPGRGLEAAVECLVAVGHTSGWHLAAGLFAGLAPDRRPVAIPAGSAP